MGSPDHLQLHRQDTVARLRAEALSKPTSHTLVDSAQKEGKASETPDSRGGNTGVEKPTLAMIEVMMSRARGLKSASLVVSASWTSASLEAELPPVVIMYFLFFGGEPDSCPT